VNVIKVLDQFEEDGFPARIDDPLADPRAPSKDQARLHETIRSLNNKIRFIRFHADGTGKGIRWEPTP